jgi:hypothetical protein
MKLTHWYHVYAVNNWADICTQHLDALEQTPFTIIRLGVVGDPDVRSEVTSLFTQRIKTQVVAEADKGFEQVTLTALWEAGQRDEAGDAILYCHVKGVTEPADYWRGEMTEHLVAGWETCVKALETHEVVGCHWMRRSEDSVSFFGGNFFWSRSSVIRRLPKPDDSTRWEAEVWLGQADPVALDMNPGHPRR